jgi:hypothetical protein
MCKLVLAELRADLNPDEGVAHSLKNSERRDDCVSHREPK